MSIALRLLGTLAFIVGSISSFGATVAKDVWIKTLWEQGVRDMRLLAPDVRVTLGLLVAGLVLMTIGNVTSSKKLSESTSHGSARFASTAELRAFGYSEASVGRWRSLLVRWHLSTYPHLNGVVVGQEESAILTMRIGESGSPALTVNKSAPLIIVREHHVAVEGPPGSGKDVSVAAPALWYDIGRSVVVLDPKGEQYENTAGARKAFSIVRRFAPTEEYADRFNPLCVVPVGTQYEVAEAERIANALLAVTADEKDPSTFYNKSAQPLLAAAIVYALNNPRGRTVAEKAESRSLAGAFDVLAGGGKPESIAADICAGLPESAKYLSDMLVRLSQDKKTIQSMFTTALNKLDFCRNPTVRRAISGSDFVPTDLSDRDVPFSLYLVIPFEHADTLRPLMRLVLNTLVSSHRPKPKFKTCYYLNEFPSIGAVPAIPRAAAEIRGYGVQFVLFWQSEGQILETYGRSAGQAILDVCRAKVMLGVTGKLSAETASALAGKTTLVRARSTTAVSKKSVLEVTHTKTSGEGEQARELLTPDEVRTLGPDKLLIWLPYLHTYVAKRCVSYSQPRFKVAASIKAPPSRAQESPNAR